jgi:hypothetical protein
MNSPFLLQNILVLLLLTAIFSGSLYLLLSKKIGNFICHRSKILLVIYRATTTIVSSLSLIGLLIGFWLFYIIEINDVSRDCWKRTAQWQTIVPGMPLDKVTEIMGNPFYAYNFENGQQATYCLNPIDQTSGTIVFNSNSNGTEFTVSSKIPDDEEIPENSRGWIPQKSSSGYATYAEIISDSSSFCAFYGLFGLAILSLYPFKMGELDALRMIYTPLAAFVFKTIYENHQTTAWHFELFPISSLLTVILIGWIIRLGIILAPD